MDLTLTEPSQVSEASPGEGEQQRLVHLRKPRRGQVRLDLSCALIAGSQVSARGKSQTGVPYVLIEFALERLIDLVQLRESELYDPREPKTFLMLVPFGSSQR